MKEEALKLADEWDWMTEEKLAKWGDDTQAMIRRLVEELDKQEHCCPDCGCHFVGEYPFNNAPQTKPFPWGDVSNEKLIQEVRDRGYKIRNAEIQTKPLSDEEILELTKDATIFEYREFDDDMVRFARAIEERHGIK